MSILLKNFLILSLFSMFLINCNTKSDDKNKPKYSLNIDADTPLNKKLDVAVTGVPDTVMQKLLDECTYIDYIFHTLPFSLSQEEDASINQNILYIDYGRPMDSLPAHCKAIARKFFHIKGEIVYDVDVYFSPGCMHFVFVKDNKPLYANYMTNEGVAFYNKMIALGKNPKQ